MAQDSSYTPVAPPKRSRQPCDSKQNQEPSWRNSKFLTNKKRVNHCSNLDLVTVPAWDSSNFFFTPLSLQNEGSPKLVVRPHAFATVAVVKPLLGALTRKEGRGFSVKLVTAQI